MLALNLEIIISYPTVDCPGHVIQQVVVVEGILLWQNCQIWHSGRGICRLGCPAMTTSHELRALHSQQMSLSKIQLPQQHHILHLVFRQAKQHLQMSAVGGQAIKSDNHSFPMQLYKKQLISKQTLNG